MFKYFIWDYDGTLFDTYPAITSTYQEVLKKEYCVDSDFKEILCWASVSLNYCSESIANKFGINLNEFRMKFGKLYSENPVKEEPPFAGAKEICELIKSVGGKNYIITHRDEKSLLKLLGKYNMKVLFEDLITRDYKFPKKPDPQAFLYLIKKYHLNPIQTLGIGDREIDIKASKLAGITSCYINYEGIKNEIADFNIKESLGLRELIGI